jgi:hypothetical protein
MVLSKRQSKSKSKSLRRRVSRKVKQIRNRNKRGGAVRMPLEYFGGDSGRYFPAGDAKLADGSSAYGSFYSVSQGVPSPDGQMFGPNVGPYPGASCTQTGGRKKSKKSKKHTNRR